METVNDIVKEMRDGIVASGWYEQTLKEFADRLDAAYRRDMQSMVDAGEINMSIAIDEVTSLRKENERLKAALKPVLEVGWEERRYNYCSGTVPTKDLFLAVRDAQRIYNGGAT